MPEPNALATLLRLKQADPMLDETNYLGANDPYASMVPEQDIADLQTEYGTQGAASGKPFFIPSRESLQQSAGTKLRQMFAVKQADAQAKALPEQVKGEYGLQGERIKGQYGVQEAQAKASQADEALAERNAFAASQGDLNRQSRLDAATAAQAAINQREQSRLQNERDIQSMPLRPKAVPPSGGGFLDWLKSLLGGGGETPAAAPTAAAPAPQRVGRFLIQ